MLYVELCTYKNIEVLNLQFNCLSCLTFCNPIDWSTPGFPVHHQLPELAQHHAHPVGDTMQLSHPLSSPSLSAFNLPQNRGLLQWVSSLHRVAKVLEFQLQHQFFYEYSGMISFRIHWFDFLAVQGTLKSLFQHHNLKASILWHSDFFVVQCSYPCMTTGKMVALTIWTFVCKVKSLLLNTLSICHSYSSKEQVSFNLMAAVTVHSDFGAQEKKICHCFHFPPFFCHEVMGRDAMISVFWMLSFKPAFPLSSFTLIKRLFFYSTFCH